ncbi:MAG: response regulator [Epsilonproteobacteria bacterium]|nr:response regulator [Campylobacterota bacterium]
MSTDLNILIIDDVLDNIQVIMNVLKEDNYNLAFATSGKEALELVKENDYDLILLDIMMPEMDGYEVCEHIKAIPGKRDIPIIFLTAKTSIDNISKAFKVGGVDYITKPFNAEELLARTKTHLELYTLQKKLIQNNITLKIKNELSEKRLKEEIYETQRELIYMLAEITEVVSDETGKHIKRVANASKLLAHYCPSLSEEDEEIIFTAAPMHDVGKIAVDPNILHKPGPLTDEEFEIVKTHTKLAKKILGNSDRKVIQAANIIALQHHERWDGTGYPDGLKGHDIHIYGRIVAIVDVFDALVHKRVYKSAWDINKAKEHIIKGAGSHFDPDLVKIFIEHFEEFAIIEDE